jgi:hypothetical protein
MFKGNKVFLADSFYSNARKVPNNTRDLDFLSHGQAINQRTIQMPWQDVGKKNRKMEIRDTMTEYTYRPSLIGD